MKRTLDELARIRQRTISLLITQRVGHVVAGLLGGVILLALIDFMMRWPSGTRVFQLLLIVAALVLVAWRHVWPAISFRPKLTDLALRIERHVPGVRGHLASGLELSEARDEQQSPLAAEAVADAERRAAREKLASIIDPQRTWISIMAAVFVLLIAGVFTVATPQHTSIALQRILLPAGNAEWPKRTGVESELADGSVFPLGEKFPLRAEITKGYHPEMRVLANYRLQKNDGSVTDWEQVVLTHQSDAMFERLIEPEARRVEVWFESDDDQTDVVAIDLVERPAIQHAWLDVRPPAYAQDILPNVIADLGPGSDHRAVAPQAGLKGGQATLILELNKPIPAPASGSATAAWSGILGFSTIRGEDVTSQVQIEAMNRDESRRSDTWRVMWTLGETTRIRPRLVDEHGIQGPEELGYRVDVVEDHAPSVTIVEPLADHSVLPTALVDLEAEARDDVQVGSLAIDAVRLVDAAASNPDENAEEVVGPASGSESLVATTEAAALVSAKVTLDVATLDARPGDIIEVQAIAADVFRDASTPGGHVATSTPRRLRVISEGDFVEQLQQDLAAVRDNAIRMEGDQADLISRAETSVGGPGSSEQQREQARLGQRIMRQRDILENLGERIAQNQLENQELADTVAEAQALLEQAGRASNSAGEGMAQMQQAEAEGSDEEQDAAREQIEQGQEEVRDELADVIELLDRGRDAWVVRRQVEQLLDRQREVSRRSSEQANATRGRTVDQLTQAEQEELEDIAEEQEELAEQARDLLDDLRDESRELEEENQDLANAMRDAAQRASREGLESTMEQAAEQLRNNQSQRANENQEQAEQTLENMLDQLEQTERARVQRLQRQLSSIIESLENLVADQETELAALVEAGQDGPFDDFDKGMIQLNTNTFGVMEVAAQAGRELAAVTELVGEAGMVQERAIRGLRTQPVPFDDVEDAENLSLTTLQEALELAESMQEQLEQEERRDQLRELMQAYRELYDRQVQLRNETNDLATGKSLSRRDRITARKLAQAQGAIQTEAIELLRQTEDLDQALVFKATHDQIDALAQIVIESLRGTTVEPDIPMNQQDIADLFLALSEALRQAQSDSEFNQPGQQGGQGGGGGGGGAGGGEDEQGLIPDMAQLRLLRALQDAVYRSTRNLDDIGNAINPEVRARRLKQLGESQQQLVELAGDLLLQLQDGEGGGQVPVDIEPTDEPEGN